VSGLAILDAGPALPYLLAVLIPALDALIPVLPSETAVIALGVATASSADPRIGALAGLAALGAFLGDNAAYLVGRRFGPVIGKRLLAGERGAQRRAWAERCLNRFGARIIVICRFIPGGRTAVTLTCGLAGYSRRSFVAATAVAAVLWAGYAFCLGRLGGQAFEDRPWSGLALALGLALAVSALIEAGRWAWRRHASRTRRASASEARRSPSRIQRSSSQAQPDSVGESGCPGSPAADGPAGGTPLHALAGCRPEGSQ
jgi:membrane-associated protein